MSTTQSSGGSLIAQYERFLWGTMEQLGIMDSIERKVLTAVGIQFLAAVALVIVPFVFSGILWYTVTAFVFLGAIVATLNTVLIIRRDFTDPIQRLESEATAIANGEVKRSLERTSQSDEIGSLTNSFVEMIAYLETVSTQADALARQEFADPALEEEVPGAFGDSLGRMAENLEAYTAELEEMTAQLEQRSDRLDALVQAFSDAAKRAQDGDLTATIDASALTITDDEHEQLVADYNTLVETLAHTVGDVQSFAAEVDGASDDVAVSMTEIDQASGEVATSVEEISSGALQQTGDLQTVAAEMNNLSATVEEIAASADDVAATAEQAAERSRAGRDSSREAIAELDELERGIRETAEAVEQLGTEISAVEEIISVIDGIAEQTNMLALNASIEAARAGDAGDGFAVVAEEVKSLAEETQTYAQEIATQVETVQTSATETVNEVNNMETQVGESVSTIETTLTDFDGIVDQVTDVNSTIQEISRATDEQAHTTQEVVGMVDDVATISQQTASEAETASAAAEEQTAAITNSTKQVRTLSDQATDLQSMLASFTVDINSTQQHTLTGGSETANERTKADENALLATPQRQ